MSRQESARFRAGVDIRPRRRAATRLSCAIRTPIETATTSMPKIAASSRARPIGRCPCAPR